MLLPNTEGFSLTLSSSKTENQEANLKFRFFGINGAAHTEYERVISQSIPLSNVSTRLTVSVKSKIVRFQNNGNYFYWRKIVHLGKIINTIKTQNKYLLDDDGYEQVQNIGDECEPISTIGYADPREINMTIRDNSCFKIGCNIEEDSYVYGSLELSGELKFMKTFNLDYIVPPNGEYILNQGKYFFENIWAMKN